MAARFKHLEVTETVGYDWTSNVLQKSLPKRAFINPFSANFVLSIELIVLEFLTKTKSIRTYFRS